MNCDRSDRHDDASPSARWPQLSRDGLSSASDRLSRFVVYDGHCVTMMTRAEQRRLSAFDSRWVFDGPAVWKARRHLYDEDDEELEEE